MRGIAVWLLSLVAVACGSASSRGDSVQALFLRCNAEQGSPAWLYCLGEVGGMGEVMMANGVMISEFHERTEHLATFAYCAGKTTVNYGVRLQVFKNWAQGHPELWQEPEVVGVATALREAWPCR